MKRRKSVLILSTFLLVFTTICVNVYATGLLEIDPTWPIMTDTEETFEIYVKNGGTAYYPQLFLVMTETCQKKSLSLGMTTKKSTSNKNAGK